MKFKESYFNSMSNSSLFPAPYDWFPPSNLPPILSISSLGIEPKVLLSLLNSHLPDGRHCEFDVALLDFLVMLLDELFQID